MEPVYRRYRAAVSASMLDGKYISSHSLNHEGALTINSSQPTRKHWKHDPSYGRHEGKEASFYGHHCQL